MTKRPARASYSNRRPPDPRPRRSVAAHESANETKESRKAGWVRVWRSSLMCEGPFPSRRRVPGWLRKKNIARIYSYVWFFLSDFFVFVLMDVIRVPPGITINLKAVDKARTASLAFGE